MRAMLLFVLSFVLFTSAGVSPATAVVIDQGSRVRLHFDFLAGTRLSPPMRLGGGVDTDAFASPPFDNMLFQLHFGADDFTAGEVFSIQAFSSTGISASDRMLLTSASSSTGGAIESSFGGPAPTGVFGLLDTFDGYLELSLLVGSFDLTSFWVLAHPVTGEYVGTGWFVGGHIEPLHIEEPSTMSLLALLVGLVALTARLSGLPGRRIQSWAPGTA